jgi:putative ABC transport system ATP-binding protein
MNSSSACVELCAVSHGYRQGQARVRVLENVTETFRLGEFAVLLGRSGSGKTTLLNLVAGMEVPDSGEIRVMGEAVSTLPESDRAAFRRRHVGVVFQAFTLVPTLCAWENVALPLTLLGTALGPARRQAVEELERLGLGGLAMRRPAELSGGEQQRVAIARAVVHRPPLLLADEPTGNLDLETALEVVSRLVELVRDHRITLLMATHSLEVAGHADRTLAMVSGRLQERPRP